MIQKSRHRGASGDGLINMQGSRRNVALQSAGAEMTEYVIKEIGRHQWLVFADRRSIAVCADETEALKLITEHSAASSRSRNSADDYGPVQNPPA